MLWKETSFQWIMLKTKMQKRAIRLKARWCGHNRTHTHSYIPLAISLFSKAGGFSPGCTHVLLLNGAQSKIWGLVTSSEKVAY